MAGPLLFTPLTLRGVTLRNRIVVSPMCQYSAVDGAVQDWHFAHHSRFALGGVGAGFVEATGVTRDGRITYGCTGIYDDAHIPGLRRIAEIYRANGALAGIQIGHAGRKGSSARPWDGAGPLKADDPEPAWETVGPSALPMREGWPAPRALTVPEIHALIDAFRAATRRALAAGFDLLEIHGAHGYLVHSFFSPLSNRRIDDFGGSIENRMRFPLMVAKAVRAVWPQDKPLFYRVSAVDAVEGGVTIDDTVALAGALREAGVDVIDCSSGGIFGPVALRTVQSQPGFQIPFAEAVKKGAGIRTMAVGQITEPREAEDIVAQGKADLVSIAREFLADPNWAYRAARELGVSNPHAILPLKYAFYLERRAAMQRSDRKPMLTIYGIARTRTSRTLWMAHELGVPYRHVKTSKLDGSTVTPEFLALNPNARVPTIDDDGVVVWESVAINLYLAKRCGGPLAPRDLAEDAHMTMWSVWAMTELEPEAHEVLLHTLNLPEAERKPARIAHAMENLRRPMLVLETALTKGNGYLVGGRFTVADINAAGVVFYLRGAPDALNGWPAIAKWYRAATERPAFKTMMKLREEG